jgi:RNA polymerase sigma factor (sigma-70 family)
MSVYNGTVSLQDCHFEEADLQQRQVTENPVVETRIPPIKSSVVLDTIFFNSAQSVGEYSCQSLVNDAITEDIGCPYKSPAFLSSIPSHMKRLCEYKLLSAEMEQHLFTKLNACKFHIRQVLQAVDTFAPSIEQVETVEALESTYHKIRSVLIQSNTRLVISVAKRYTTKAITFDDLLSAGIEALVETIDKFNVLLGYRFSTYMCTVLNRKCARYRENFFKSSSRFVTGLDDGEFAVAEQNHDKPITPEMSEELQERLGMIDGRAFYILQRRFGLDNAPRATLRELADELLISKERIRQIEKKTLSEIKRSILKSQDSLLTSELIGLE